MAEQYITLRPNTGFDLDIDGADYYHLGLDTDWGESSVDASLLEGPDITGAIAGQRRLLTRQRSLVIQVRAESGADYINAAEALAACVSNLQRYGGTIARQVGIAGEYTETLECEILEASLSEAEDGWLEATRLHGEVVLNLTTNPAWLADWELAASGAATFLGASMIEVPVDALRGNLPSPGRIVFTDGASTARRFIELGGAFENFTTDMETEFRAGAGGGDLNLAIPGSADSTSVDDRIGTYTIAVTPVLPAWTTAVYTPDLPYRGTFNVRARVLHEDEDVTVTVRALWRSGTGAWHELESATIPGDGWWDLRLGTISHYDSAETFEVRFDVRASEVTSETFRLNIVTITAADLYTVARGQATQGALVGAAGYDDMAADDTDMATRSAQLGGAWTAFGSGDQFTDLEDTQTREYTDANTTLGRGYVLSGLTGTTVQTVVIAGFANATAGGSNTIIGGVFRYVDASNFGLVALRCRRKSSGNYYYYASLYKNIAGTHTLIEQKAIDSALGTVAVSVNADGEYEVSFSALRTPGIDTERLFAGTETEFATSGDLETGKMGFYGASDSAANTLRIYNFIGYGDTNPSIVGEVIRADGTGELTYADAFSAEADGSDPQPVSSAEGRRIWLPPGLDGQITAKVRTSDSDAEVDTGFSNNTDVDVYHRPAFATISDALGEPPDEELVML